MQDKEIHIEIGQRLKLIREKILFDGTKLSAQQFADKLEISRDKIVNYESGRSGVPDVFLIKLFKLGINPTFILTGEGDVFAHNEEGNILRSRKKDNREKGGNVEVLGSLDVNKLTDDELIDFFRVAAGNIRDRLKDKK